MSDVLSTMTQYLCVREARPLDFSWMTIYELFESKKMKTVQNTHYDTGHDMISRTRRLIRTAPS